MTFTTTTYCKPTSTGLLTNFTSFTAYAYKTGLIRTLTDRACKINSTVQALQHDLKRISDTLQKNMFPRNIINRVMSTTEEKHAQAPNNATETDTDTLTTDNNTRLTRRLDTRYFKLPYIGSYSRMVTGKISNLIHDFCKPETSIKLIYDTFKVGQYFSKKDKIPSDLSSYVVYKFQCASCNACYIGETTRHLRTRMDEHLTTDSNSHVFKHVNDEEVMCQLTNDYTCFSVVDRANSKYQLKIKEALAINITSHPSIDRSRAISLSFCCNNPLTFTLAPPPTLLSLPSHSRIRSPCLFFLVVSCCITSHFLLVLPNIGLFRRLYYTPNPITIVLWALLVRIKAHYELKFIYN